MTLVGTQTNAVKQGCSEVTRRKFLTNYYSEDGRLTMEAEIDEQGAKRIKLEVADR